MAAKKDSKNYQPQPAKGYPSSSAGVRKKEQEDKRVAQNTTRNPKDKTGTSYFGETAKGKPKTTGQKFPPGTPFKQRTQEPAKPKATPTAPKPASPVTPPPASQPRGIAQSGKLVPSSKESLIKKKKK